MASLFSGFAGLGLRLAERKSPRAAETEQGRAETFAETNGADSPIAQKVPDANAHGGSPGPTDPRHR